MAASAAMVASATVPPLAAGGQYDLCILGDSLGVGISQALSNHGIPHTGTPKGSTTAPQWASVIAERLPSTRSLVVVALGTNDALSPQIKAEFPEHMRAITRAIRAAGHAVLWILPAGPSTLPDDATWRVVADEQIQTMTPRVEMADKWHPTGAGYDAIGRQIVEHLMRLIDGQVQP